MSTFVPSGPVRHPLGLPAGSVRSILSIVIVGMTCALATYPFEDPKLQRIPPYLVYLFLLVLGSFFAAHGNSIDKEGSNEPSPLYLPRGLVRILIILALIGTIGWSVYKDWPELLHWKQVMQNTTDKIKEKPWMPVFILGGFILGALARMLFGGGTKAQNPTYQDIIAWVSLLAMVGITIQFFIDFVINPSLQEQTPMIEMPAWEGILSGVIAFYFSARS